MPTEGEILYNAGYRFAFSRSQESGRFEATPFNPAVPLPSDPFTDRAAWQSAYEQRYGVHPRKTNGDKVGERLGPFNAFGDNNPIWAAWCREHGVAMTWESYTDTLLLAKPGRTQDGETHITAWDDWISKTVVPGDPRPPSDLEAAYGRLLAENEKLKKELELWQQRAEEEEGHKRQVAALLKAQTTSIVAALAKVTIKPQGGGVPMMVLREIQGIVK